MRLSSVNQFNRLLTSLGIFNVTVLSAGTYFGISLFVSICRSSSNVGKSNERKRRFRLLE